MNLKNLFVALFFVIFFSLTRSQVSHAQSGGTIDLREYIADPSFTPHSLSTGEQIRYAAEGGTGPEGSQPARMYKNANYEQIFVGPGGIYRREDTSWAPQPGFGDAHCSSSGEKAIYTLDPGCTYYTDGAAITSDGAKWAPATATIGQSWSTQPHQIVTIDSVESNDSARIYCGLSDLDGYQYSRACNQSTTLQLAQFIPANSGFRFCTGSTNPEDMIKIITTNGAGTGDTFYYMKGWGLVGFEAPGFEAGLMYGPNADASGCDGPQGGAANQFRVQERVPCDQVGRRDVEFHSLRPYPTNPCETDPYANPLAMLCGNDLIVKESFVVNPVKLGCAVSPEEGGQCVAEVESDISVGLNSGSAYLPILGNTELVPNVKSSRSRISFAQRVNEYVSWYLNGTTGRAEELWENPGLQSNIEEVINFSGPLKKLLPREIKVFERQEEKDTIGSQRHNQIAVCRDSEGKVVQCYRQTSQERKRLTDIEASYPDIPPSVWSLILGGSIGDWINLIFGGTIPGANNYFVTYNSLSQYLPLSSTEDAIGIVNISDPSLLGGSLTQGNLTVNSISLEETDLSGSDINDKEKKLYYAHIYETDQLAELLQGTFKTKDVVADDPGDAELIDEFKPEDYPSCEILEANSNPGDDLHGEVVNSEAQEQPTGGTLSYSAEFTCNFPPADSNETRGCFYSCSPIAGTDINGVTSDNVPYDLAPPELQSSGARINATRSECQEQCWTCKQNIPIRVSVKTQSPLLDTIWSKLVSGSQSVFKRIMPKIGDEDSPIEQITDIPGESPVQYSSTNIQTNHSDWLDTSETLAGDPTLSKPGSSAKLFFPHLGSVYDHFLKDIQKALRPKGLKLPVTSGGTTSDPSTQICTATNSGFASTAMFNLVSNAARWANVPVQVLIAVVRKEACNDSNVGATWLTGGICAMNDEEVIRYSQPGAQEPNCDALGTLEFFPGLWSGYQNAVNMATGENRTPEICNFKDSIYAAALALSWGYVAQTCPPSVPGAPPAPSASSWSLDDMKRSLSRWAAGCYDNTSRTLTCQALDQYNATQGRGGFAGEYCRIINFYTDPSSERYINQTCN